MEWDAKLIYVYCTVCEFFSQIPAHQKIRKCPNQNLEFTDEEVLAIYFYGLIECPENFSLMHLK